MKILLLEDDFSLNKVITSYLLTQSYFVDSYTTGDHAAKQLLQAQYDLCILDINVPHIDGNDLLNIIRKENITTPVIMISALHDLESIKKAYAAGCNDYIKKPFEIEELSLRIRYALKGTLTEENDVIPLKHGYFFNPHTMLLLKNNISIDLSSKEQLMLALLVNNLDKVVTTQMFQDYVWNGEYVEAVSMRSVMHKLKAKLKSAMIINVRGVGYKLLGESR